MMVLPEELRLEEAHVGHVVKALLHSVRTPSPLGLPIRIAFIGNYLPRRCGIAKLKTYLRIATGAE